MKKISLESKMLSIFIIGMLGFLLTLSYVFATQITPQVPVGPYPGTVAAGDLDITWAAATIGSTTFTVTGKELLLIHNTGIDSATLTLVSVADRYKRSGTISDYALDGDEYAAFWIGNIIGWRDSAGTMTIQSNTSGHKIAIIRIP